LSSTEDNSVIIQLKLVQ